VTEGLAVGVGFGAIGKTASATFENARYVMLSNWTNNILSYFLVIPCSIPF